MAFIPTPNSVKVEMNGTQNGVQIVNVFHVKTTGTVSSADLDDILACFDAYWTDLKAGVHSSYELNNFTATDISVINGTQTVFPYTTGNVGTAAGDAAAANAAMCASFRTNLTGRSYRGRMYLGGLAQSGLTSAQTFSTGYAASIVGVIQDLMTALDAVNMTLCVLSKVALGVARIAGVLTEILTVTIDTKVDSQRRRTAN